MSEINSLPDKDHFVEVYPLAPGNSIVKVVPSSGLLLTWMDPLCHKRLSKSPLNKSATGFINMKLGKVEIINHYGNKGRMQFQLILCPKDQ
jgi:hypothetical protein